MFFVSNMKRKRRDRMRRLRRQAMYEENRSDVVVREQNKLKQSQTSNKH